ncbi:MAG TPA: aminotransferase class IV [Candidatus Kapabacteria bacterium]|nr:aminotransferase class IV [Candidatus Kapabacteria bacterium]
MSIVLEPCRWTYVAGRLLPAERAVLPADCHPVHYGSAAFESLRIYRTAIGSRLVGLDGHLDRLEATMQQLRLMPVDRSLVRRALLDVIAANELEDGYIRLLAYPNGNCTRLDPAAQPSDLLIVAWRVNGARFSPPLTLGVADVRRPPAFTSLPLAKHSGMYGVYAALHSAARAEGFDDALVLHADGTVCEVTGANIFLARDGRLATPTIPDSIDGLTRKLVIELAADIGIATEERPLRLEDFAGADEIFITGTFHGLRPVSAIDGTAPRLATPGPLTLALQRRYEQMLDAPSESDGRWVTTIPSAARNGNGNGHIPATFRVRPAQREDIPAVVEGVRLLLEELRGVPGIQLPAGAETVCARTIEGRTRGAIFVAAPNGPGSGLIGLLCLNVLESVHVGGAYGLIQDLWVRNEHRSDGVGAALVAAAENYCREHRLNSMEVCLPSHRFPRLPRTHNFYQSCGFIELGPRMRKEVS